MRSLGRSAARGMLTVALLAMTHPAALPPGRSMRLDERELVTRAPPGPRDRRRYVAGGMMGRGRERLPLHHAEFVQALAARLAGDRFFCAMHYLRKQPQAAGAPKEYRCAVTTGG